MAFDFDGANDSIHWGSSTFPSLDVNTLTIAAWVNVGSSPGAGAREVMIGLGTVIGGTSMRRMVTQELAGTIRMALQADWATTDGLWHGSTALTAGTWYHLALTYDRSGAAPGNDPVFYVNGVSETVTETSTPAGAVQTGDDSVRIGESISGTLDFDGTVAEAGIWSRILSADEIAALGKGYAPDYLPNGLRFYTPLDDTAAVERVTGIAATLVGGTRVDHPPNVIRFPKLRVATVVAGGTKTEYYYHRRRAA